MAVTPDYGGSNPPIDIPTNGRLTLNPVPQPPPPNPPKIYNGPSSPLVSFGANSAPSAIAMDPSDGLAIVTLAGVNPNKFQSINVPAPPPPFTTHLSSAGNSAPLRPGA